MPPTADVAPATLSRAHAEAIVESYLLAIAGSQELSDKAVRLTVHQYPSEAFDSGWSIRKNGLRP